jgi:hypothetical protein
VAIDLAIFVAVIAVIVVLVWARFLRGKEDAGVLPARETEEAGQPQPLTMTLLEVQAELHQTAISALETTGGTLGLLVYLRNRNDLPVQILSQLGTLFEPQEKGLQRMIAARPQIFDIAPGGTEKVLVHAVSLDAHRDPPDDDEVRDYQVTGIIDDPQIFKVFRAVEKLEYELARHVVAFDKPLRLGADPLAAGQPVSGDRVRFEEMPENLMRLSGFCTVTREEEDAARAQGAGRYQARIRGSVIQYALWQVSDGLTFDQLTAMLHAHSPEARAELMPAVRGANFILHEARIEPTMAI